MHALALCRYMMVDACSNLQASAWPEDVTITQIIDSVRQHGGGIVCVIQHVWVVVPEPEGILREEDMQKFVPAMCKQLEDAARVRLLSLLPTPGETAGGLATLVHSLPFFMPVADALTERLAAQDTASIAQAIAFATARAVFVQPALAIPGGAPDACVKEVLADFSTAPQDDKEILVLFLRPAPHWRETVGLEPRTVDYLQAILRRENLRSISQREKDSEALEGVKAEAQTGRLQDETSVIDTRLADLKLGTQKTEDEEGQEQRRAALRVAVAEKLAEVATKQQEIEALRSSLLKPLPPLVMPPEIEAQHEEELARAIGPLQKRDEAVREKIQGIRKEWDKLDADIPSLKEAISEASARTQALLPVRAKVLKEIEEKEAELAKAHKALERYTTMSTAPAIVLQHRPRDKEER